MRKLAPVAVCIAAFFAGGGHWALLQGAAWSAMLFTYSLDSGSLTEGAHQTFSGEAPCALCLRIADAREVEETRLPEWLPERHKEVFVGTAQACLPVCCAGDHRFSAIAVTVPDDWTPERPAPIPIG